MNILSFTDKYLNFNYLKSYLSFIKKYAICSIVILIISFILGIMYCGDISYLMNMIMADMADSMEIFGIAGFIDIFTHNLQSDLIMIFGGVLFSIISIFGMFINGAMLGYVATITPIFDFLLLIIPHGIFEIPSWILSLSAAFMITTLIIRLLSSLVSDEKTIKDEINDSKDLIEAIIVSIVLVVILLLIAGFIENFITGALYQFIMSII